MLPKGRAELRAVLSPHRQANDPENNCLARPLFDLWNCGVEPKGQRNALDTEYSI